MSRLDFARRPASLIVGLVLLAVVLVLLNVVAARHYRRVDVTGNRVYSLSAKTEQLLRGLTQQVRVTVFMVPPERSRHSAYYATRELLRRFVALSPQVSLEYVDIDAQSTRVAFLAQQYQLNKADLREGLVVLALGKRVRQLRSSQLTRLEQRPAGQPQTAFRGEAALFGALLALTTEQPARVCFTHGHGEAPTDSYEPGGYGHIWDETRRDNHEARVVGPASWPGVLRGCDAVVIGGPTRGFAPAEARGLDSYLQDGGRLLLLIGPLLDRRVTRYRDSGLEQLLAAWGVGLAHNVVLDPLAVPGEQPLLTWATQSGYGGHAIGRALRGHLTVWPLAREVRPLPGARPGLETWRIVSSSPKGWAEADLAALRGEGQLRFDPAVDVAGPVSVAVAVRWRRTRLVVFGSERGVVNDRLARPVRRDFNRDLFLGAVNWLVGKEQVVAVGPKSLEHAQLALDDRVLDRVFLFSVVGLPVLALCLGMLVWYRRRR